jgi:ribosomal protein L9
MRRAEHQWNAKNPEGIANGCRSFWINAFSSPWTSWSYIITRFLEARDDPEKLKTVYNTLFGQLWEERGEVQSEGELADRREDYDADLPDGVLCLTCGVDTQDNRIEYEVVGHGTFGETWGIERGVFWGRPDAQDTPTEPSVWTRLDSVIDRRWAYKDGKTLRVSLTFVDSGGHYTNEVYRACAERMDKRVFAIKGKGGEGDVVEVARGFANNYLLPQGYAIKATPGNLKQLEQRKSNIATREEKRVAKANETKATLDAAAVKVLARVGEEGVLFGSVTTQQIAAAVAEQTGIEIDRRDISVKESIKKAGEYTATVALYRDIKANLTVLVGDEASFAEPEVEAEAEVEEAPAEETAEVEAE